MRNKWFKKSATAMGIFGGVYNVYARKVSKTVGDVRSWTLLNGCFKAECAMDAIKKCVAINEKDRIFVKNPTFKKDRQGVTYQMKGVINDMELCVYKH